jgi:hypothetical protein
LARLLLAGAVTTLLAGCGQSLELGPGVRAAAAPVQTPLAEMAAPHSFRHGDFILTPRAEFSITAKLLSKRRYRWDAMAPLAPWDFAVGWGLMSDESVLEWVHLTQGDRFLFRKLLDSALPLERIEHSSANLHLIPADSALLSALAAVPPGAIVTLAGVLVDAHDEENAVTYSTSLSRSDRGAGACEILLVRAMEVSRGILADPGPDAIALSLR